MIGAYAFQVASLSAQLEQAMEKIKELEKQKEEKDGGGIPEERVPE